MNLTEAKERLQLHRPGDSADTDAGLRAALDQARHDENLGRWLEAQHHFHQQMEGVLKTIPVPAGLSRRICAAAAETPKTRPFPLRAWPWWAMAACLVLFFGVLAYRARSPVYSFENFRDRMARTVLRDYRMTMASPSLAEIRRYIQEHGTHGGFILPKGLASTGGQGCLLTTWQGRPVSLVCLQNQAGQELWLFMINRAEVAQAPGAEPVFAQFRSLGTYSWTNGGMVYLLAGKMDAAALRHYL